MWKIYLEKMAMIEAFYMTLICFMLLNVTANKIFSRKKGKSKLSNFLFLKPDIYGKFHTLLHLEKLLQHSKHSQSLEKHTEICDLFHNVWASFFVYCRENKGFPHMT